MIKPELLLPAGNIEKMKYALHYGADAVYLGTGDYSLRNTTQGDIITTDNLKTAIEYAHALNKKVYVTVNIYAHNDDIDNLPPYLEFLEELKPDSLIFSDIGVGTLAKKYCPSLPLHVSTQANTTNYASAQAWKDFGAERIILARELSLKEIETIKSKVPGLELEIFIHGSLCISYSGRCILSDYMTDNKRKSNHGGCAQPCRWKYHLVEEKRPGEYFEILEDNRGTYIMNSKDICLMPYLKEIMDLEIHSLKVEGRTKSIFYVSTISRAYQSAINKILNNQEINLSDYEKEVSAAGNRGFTTNFLTDKPQTKDYDYQTSKGKAGLTFLAASLSDKIVDGKLLVKVRNQFKLNQKVEWITPTQTIPATITLIETDKAQHLDVINTNFEVFVNAPDNLSDCQWAIIRSEG